MRCTSRNERASGPSSSARIGHHRAGHRPPLRRRRRDRQGRARAARGRRAAAAHGAQERARSRADARRHCQPLREPPPSSKRPRYARSPPMASCRSRPSRRGGCSSTTPRTLRPQMPQRRWPAPTSSSTAPSSRRSARPGSRACTRCSWVRSSCAPGRCSLDDVIAPVAAQPPREPLVRPAHGGDPRGVLGLVVAQPAQLRHRERGDAHKARAACGLGRAGLDEEGRGRRRS